MPATSINDCSIQYEIYGHGPPIVITGGGREAMTESRPLAEKLSERYRVILWDRATIGCSDIQFNGPRDLDLWATQLATLLQRIGAAPAFLIAPSNGARVSMVTALRYPEVVRGLFLFLITGGTERGATNLRQLFLDTADLAGASGMQAVAQMEYWAERIAANPASRGRLLSMNPSDVARTLRRWAAAFDPTHTIMGLSDDDLARIHAPAWVLDATEPTTLMRRYNRELAERLPRAELIVDEEFQAQWSKLSETYGLGQGRYTEAAALPRLIDQFLQTQLGDG